MHSGKFVFSQIMVCVPHWEFQRMARRHGVDSPKFGFRAWEHFSAMAFAQLAKHGELNELRGKYPNPLAKLEKTELQLTGPEVVCAKPVLRRETNFT